MCFNISNKCDDVSKLCGTDSKIGLGFVVKCSMFNKIKPSYSNGESVAVANQSETRVEMMGGGYDI